MPDGALYDRVKSLMKGIMNSSQRFSEAVLKSRLASQLRDAMSCSGNEIVVTG